MTFLGRSTHLQSERAFTLLEMALVLLVLGILMRVSVVPLSAAKLGKDRKATTFQLEAVRQSLLAYVVAHGVLPCPKKLSSNGDVGEHATVNANQSCTRAQGSLPAVALGIPGAIDSTGALLDIWGRPYLYAVSMNSHSQKGLVDFPDWTSEGEATRVGIAAMSADIRLCQAEHLGRCPEKDVRASDIVFVVLSLGADPSLEGLQRENQDEDVDYLVHELSRVKGAIYDDQIVWASASDVIFWMLQAGWLP